MDDGPRGATIGGEGLGLEVVGALLDAAGATDAETAGRVEDHAPLPAAVAAVHGDLRGAAAPTLGGPTAGRVPRRER